MYNHDLYEDVSVNHGTKHLKIVNQQVIKNESALQHPSASLSQTISWLIYPTCFDLLIYQGCGQFDCVNWNAWKLQQIWQMGIFHGFSTNLDSKCLNFRFFLFEHMPFLERCHVCWFLGNMGMKQPYGEWPSWKLPKKDFAKKKRQQGGWKVGNDSLSVWGVHESFSQSWKLLLLDINFSAPMNGKI